MDSRDLLPFIRISMNRPNG